ncbi:peroxidase-like [Myzus persicae]|uniref:peroxidase-like n=1 Tax=Myzus persicae TaxID=13164 RepID=UPI000B935A82|nr:peroxidase-like [Myzus persicae]
MSTTVMKVRLLICSVIFVLPYCTGFKDEHIIDLYEQGLAINSTNWYLKLNTSDINEEIQKATEIIENRYRLEDTILSNISQITIGSPVHGQLIDSMPSKGGNSASRFAEIIIEATRSLKNTYCLKHGLSDIQCAKDLTKVNLTGTTLGEMCMSEYYDKIPCEVPHYRNNDGSCSNSKHKNWGKANTPYKRLLFPVYKDGIYEMPSEEKLPNPRSLSLNLVKDEISIDQGKTMMVAFWMIFIAHDLSHTAVSTMGKDNRFVNCCDKDKNIQYTLNKNMRSCKPIPIPDDDKFFKPEPYDCMNYVRSRPAVRSDCTFGPMEQMNQATHYLDGSMIYGSSEEQELSVREMSFGRLKEIDLYRYDPEFSSMPRETTDTKACQNGIGTCFKAGDIRANSFPQLTALHTLWIKEHNRIALEIHQIKPNLNDFELFHEAKRIVIAAIQHITYFEWLPALLGYNYVKESGLEVLENTYGGRTYYDENADPSVSNVFATTILPIAYSMISNIIRLNREDSNSEELSGWSSDNLTLKEYYNQPVDILKNNTHYILKGLITESAQNVDMLFTQTITNHLYSIGTNNSFGMDTLSLDIQRSRDHGIPSYTQFRKYCGLKDIENEQDLSEIMGESSADRLLKLYKTWNDIDLLVGVLLEKHAEDAMVGPTMRCIIREQFLRTKKADIFFYDGNRLFSYEQLAYNIKTYSLGAVLCVNTDIKVRQENVFLTPKIFRPCFERKTDRLSFHLFYYDYYSSLLNRLS